MEVSDPAAFLTGKVLPVGTEQEAGWAPQPLLMRRGREKFLYLPGIDEYLSMSWKKKHVQSPLTRSDM
jgi:hypothetical protein